MTFRVLYAGKAATFKDESTFAHDAPIELEFNFFGGSPFTVHHGQPGVCRLLTEIFADGEIVDPIYGGKTAPETTPNEPPDPIRPRGEKNASRARVSHAA